MDNLFFLVLRRMRAPLVILIGAYAISIGGLMLMPGTDDQGNPWRFDFFHAFYLISYTGPTIGFGEIPYAFSTAQRMWTTFTIYLTVIAWLYAIGNILALVQDQAFKRAVTEQRFTRRIKRITSRFYIICGYGETGSRLVRAMNRREIQSVVLDNDPVQINNLALEDLTFDVPNLCADVRDARHLMEAGLQHPRCIGVIALTNADMVNVKVAITSKLLNSALKVISRSESRQTAANLASFNTDHIINPFDTFADHLAMALRTPSVHLLYEWLVSVPGHPLHAPIQPPRGTWIVCGYGRFGKALHRYFQFEGIPTVIIEPHATEIPESAIVGYGTEAVTLREAGIDKAVGIIAGTNRDANNLSIIMTARMLNPNLYLVARQNRSSNDAIFKAANVDLVMQSSRIIVWRILPLLTVPLLSRFLHIARHRNEEWAKTTLDRIRETCAGVTPEIWSVDVGPRRTPALCGALEAEREIRIWHLFREPQDREQILRGFALLLIRDKEEKLMPDMEESLRIGDHLLLCAEPGVSGRMAWTLVNTNALEYVETGEERPDGYVWRWLSRWQHGHRSPH